MHSVFERMRSFAQLNPYFHKMKRLYVLLFCAFGLTSSINATTHPNKSASSASSSLLPLSLSSPSNTSNTTNLSDHILLVYTIDESIGNIGYVYCKHPYQVTQQSNIFKKVKYWFGATIKENLNFCSVYSIAGTFDLKSISDEKKEVNIKQNKKKTLEPIGYDYLTVVEISVCQNAIFVYTLFHDDDGQAAAQIDLRTLEAHKHSLFNFYDESYIENLTASHEYKRFGWILDKGTVIKSSILDGNSRKVEAKLDKSFDFVRLYVLGFEAKTLDGRFQSLNQLKNNQEGTRIEKPIINEIPEYLDRLFGGSLKVEGEKVTLNAKNLEKFQESVSHLVEQDSEKSSFYKLVKFMQLMSFYDDKNFKLVKLGTIFNFGNNQNVTMYTILEPNQSYEDFELAMAHCLAVNGVISWLDKDIQFENLKKSGNMISIEFKRMNSDTFESMKKLCKSITGPSSPHPFLQPAFLSDQVIILKHFPTFFSYILDKKLGETNRKSCFFNQILNLVGVASDSNLSLAQATNTVILGMREISGSTCISKLIAFREEVESKFKTTTKETSCDDYFTVIQFDGAENSISVYTFFLHEHDESKLVEGHVQSILKFFPLKKEETYKLTSSSIYEYKPSGLRIIAKSSFHNINQSEVIVKLDRSFDFVPDYIFSFGETTRFGLFKHFNELSGNASEMLRPLFGDGLQVEGRKVALNSEVLNKFQESISNLKEQNSEKSWFYKLINFPDCDKNNFNKIRYGMIVYFAKTNGLTIYTVMNPNQHFDDLEFAIAHYLNVKKVILNFDDKVKSNEKIASTELKFIFESDYKNLIMELYGTQNGTNNHNITQNV